MAISFDVNRPRNVDWKRAAALLYGDWGTSKAYVLGLAFLAVGYSSFPIILAVCAITGLVGMNYLVICRHFPDGGGVYSAARAQGRLLAVVGALLLVADLTVTSALSGWSALDYFHVDFLKSHIVVSTAVALCVMGWLNWYGPKHSGGLAVILSIPVVILVIVLLIVSVPHLTTAYLKPLPSDESHWEIWKHFVETILALSGVEAIANMTGVLKLDPGCDPEKPRVGREAAKAIWAVSIEVVFGTALLAWAMLSIPHESALHARASDILSYVGEYFGHLSMAQWFHNETFALAFGHALGWATGILFFLLLISAANTAMVAMIGVFYMMARDGEMPRQFGKLNSHGVPIIPLSIAVGLPIVILAVTPDFNALAGLYAIGVVGAITLNLGCCTFNRQLGLNIWERLLLGTTFLVLFCVEVTLAHEKHDALFFVICILVVGLALRDYAQKRQGLVSVTLSHDVAELVKPETLERLRPRLVEGQRIMVAARGVTPVLRFALDEAFLRKAQLLVLYVKEIAVFIPAAGQPQKQTRARWQDDPHAAAIMSLVLKLGTESGVEVLPVYAVSTDPSSTILDLTATLGVDYLFLGAPHRFSLAKLLKGDVVEQVAAGLPEDIQLLIHG